MVSWQASLGNAPKALAAMEPCSRARSLLDEIQSAGVDLDARRPPGETERLRRRESEVKAQIASLERQLAAVDARDQSGAAERLERELAKARFALYDHERAMHNSSPVYRELITRQAKLPGLDLIQGRILKPGDLMLVYLFGQEGGYVAAVTRDAARVLPLIMEDKAAVSLGMTSGPLTARRLLRRIDHGEGNRRDATPHRPEAGGSSGQTGGDLANHRARARPPP